MKRAPHLTKRERKAQRRSDTSARGPAHSFAPAACPDAGNGDGELCPSCGQNEVRVHTCSCCDDEGLGCCVCHHTLTPEETESVLIAVASRTHGGDTNITHEPPEPMNWPEGHVRVELTGDDQEECVAVWIHGHTHHLHSTTARELQRMLGERLDEYNRKAHALGFPTV